MSFIPPIVLIEITMSTTNEDGLPVVTRTWATGETEERAISGWVKTCRRCAKLPYTYRVVTPVEKPIVLDVAVIP